MAQPIATDALATNVYPYLQLANSNLFMVRGDTFIKAWYVSQNGSAYNLTGNSGIRFTAKWRPSDPDSAAVFSYTSAPNVVVTSATGGLITTTISPAATRSLAGSTSPDSVVPIILVYDLQVTDSSSNVFTVAIGQLQVMPDISIAVP